LFRLIFAPKILWGAKMAGLLSAEAAAPHFPFSPFRPPVGDTGEKGKKGIAGFLESLPLVARRQVRALLNVQLFAYAKS
jgi:hypothetical protein